MEDGEESARLSRSDVERTEPNRDFLGVWRQQTPYESHDSLIVAGKKSAEALSPHEIAAEAVANGYDMVDEFLRQDKDPDPFGFTDAMSGGPAMDDLLNGINGGAGLMNTVAHLFTQQVQFWNHLFDQLLQGGDLDAVSAFEDITGMKPHSSSDADVIVVANRSIDAKLTWRGGDAPEGVIRVTNLSMLNSSSAELPRGLKIEFKSALNTDHKVLEIKVPVSFKQGRIVGILVDEAGDDCGYLSISAISD